MTPNRITWPKCPSCGLIINDPRLLPASQFIHRTGMWDDIKCPKCKADLEINLRITYEWECELRQGANDGK